MQPFRTSPVALQNKKKCSPNQVFEEKRVFKGISFLSNRLCTQSEKKEGSTIVFNARLLFWVWVSRWIIVLFVRSQLKSRRTHAHTRIHANKTLLTYCTLINTMERTTTTANSLRQQPRMHSTEKKKQKQITTEKSIIFVASSILWWEYRLWISFGEWLFWRSLAMLSWCEDGRSVPGMEVNKECLIKKNVMCEEESTGAHCWKLSTLAAMLLQRTRRAFSRLYLHFALIVWWRG